MRGSCVHEQQEWRKSAGSCVDRVDLFFCTTLTSTLPPSLFILQEHSHSRYQHAIEYDKLMRLISLAFSLVSFSRSNVRVATGAVRYPHKHTHLVTYQHRCLHLNSTSNPAKKRPEFLSPLVSLQQIERNGRRERGEMQITHEQVREVKSPTNGKQSRARRVAKEKSAREQVTHERKSIGGKACRESKAREDKGGEKKKKYRGRLSRDFSSCL
jgi:hypothetical protein